MTRPNPAYSVTSSAFDKKSEKFSEINENDEWNAIQKFNSLLYYEEQKQALMRDAERKRLIKEELSNQVEQKHMRHKAESSENQMYDALQEEHGKLLDQREKEKAELMKAKIQTDKESRDMQLREEKRRKRFEEKDQMNQEQEYIQRLKSEMEAEKSMQAEKRR